MMNGRIGDEVNKLILAPGPDSINARVQVHISDAFNQLEAGNLSLLIYYIGESSLSLFFYRCYSKSKKTRRNETERNCRDT